MSWYYAEKIRCEKALTLSESHADEEDQWHEKDDPAHAWPRCDERCGCESKLL